MNESDRLRLVRRLIQFLHATLCRPRVALFGRELPCLSSYGEVLFAVEEAKNSNNAGASGGLHAPKDRGRLMHNLEHVSDSNR